MASDEGADERSTDRAGTTDDTWFDDLVEAAQAAPERGAMARAGERVRGWLPDRHSHTGPVEAANAGAIPAGSGPRPGSGSGRRFWRDLVVTFTAFVAAVSVVAASLWIRDGLTGRGDRAMASGPDTPLPATAAEDPTAPVPDPTPTASPSPRPERQAGQPGGATPTATPEPVWFSWATRGLASCCPRSTPPPTKTSAPSTWI